MFLDVLEKRNPKLIETAFKLHQEGKILPDTYILDLDAILYNAKLILEEANNYGIKLYAMTKQFGRNPIIAKKIIELGYSGIVAVDFKEAQLMMKEKIKLGNVGHLVQTPKALLKELVEYGSEVMTIYSIEKAHDINRYAKELNKIQKIIIRVLDENSEVYSGQMGGVYISDLDEFITQMKKYENIQIVGLTVFPCFLYDSKKNEILETKNIIALNKGIEILKNNNIEIEQINMPSSTSVKNMKKIFNLGGTHGEPGHSLTGTTQYNAKNLEGEIPGIIYVSEVSHNLSGKGYCYGGGHYRRSGMINALVGKNYKESKRYSLEAPTMESIDYYFELSNVAPIGDTVISSFRTQIFVTRSDVAVVSGISKGLPEIVGIYDSFGREKI
ncbi:MAG: YhfX family PLP-dependent enzyme [Fusobacteriaceae bacterium]